MPPIFAAQTTPRSPQFNCCANIFRARLLIKGINPAICVIITLNGVYDNTLHSFRDDAAMEFTSYAPTRTDSSSTVDLGSVSGNRSSSVDDDTGSGIAVGNSRDVEERVNEVIAMMGLEDVADAVVGESGCYCTQLYCVFFVLSIPICAFPLFMTYCITDTLFLYQVVVILAATGWRCGRAS